MRTVDFLVRGKNAKACKDENGQEIHKKMKDRFHAIGGVQNLA